MVAKLNSMRLLDNNSIPYEILEYPDNIRDAGEVADAVGLPRDMVYKTLVVQNAQQKKPLLAMIASECQLDLKKMAKAAGAKKVRMASFNDAERMTGLKVGGISALALVQKQWDVYLDKRALQLEYIVISAGQRGLQIRLPVVSLVELLNVETAEIGNC
jgi:Cys-tRNA(Pro)/Cys-tRNA(Cys) deacylase